MPENERSPRTNGGPATNNDALIIARARADARKMHSAARWHWFWKRRYPEAFDPHRMARAVAAADRVADGYRRGAA